MRIAFFDHCRLGEIFRVAAQHDVRASARHVGGDGDGARSARLRDYLRLALVILGVEHVVVFKSGAREHFRELFTLFHAHRAHQHGLFALVAFFDVFYYRLELGFFVEVELVFLVHPGNGLVGGNDHHVQIVCALEFVLFRFCRARHARKFAILAEEILEGDGGESLVFRTYLHALFRLYRLVQTVAVTPAYHLTAGELVHDDYLVVHHDVIHVVLHDDVGGEGVVYIVFEALIFVIRDVFHPEILFRLFRAPLVEINGLALDHHFVIAAVFAHRAAVGTDDVRIAALVAGDLRPAYLSAALGADVIFRFERFEKALRLFIHLVRLAAPAADDERRARLVDENAVHLVHDGKIQAALHAVFFADRHIVAQIVEAHFVIGGVCDVAGIGGALFFRLHARFVDAHAQTHEAIYLAHPVRVALGKIFVDRDHVHALARQSVEINGQCCHQRFSFTGAHFRYPALVQNNAAYQLHVEVAHVEHPGACLSDRGKSVGQDVVQPFSRRQPGFELRRAVFELLVRHGGVFVRQRFYFRGGLFQFL